jgi:fatty acid desaturase
MKENIIKIGLAGLVFLGWGWGVTTLDIDGATFVISMILVFPLIGYILDAYSPSSE